MRLGVIASHPIQYHAPLFRELAGRSDLCVFFAHRQTAAQQARAGYGAEFDWDVDLLGGYENRFLANVSHRPGVDHFLGCDTPSIGQELKGEKCDVALVLGWNLKTFHQTLWAGRAMGLPVMVRGDSQLGTARGVLKRSFKSLVYPIFLGQFAAALYVGKRSKAYFAHYGVPEDRQFFVPHCVDEPYFEARATREARDTLRAQIGIAPNDRAVLFVGRLIPFKRVPDLVDAIARLPKSAGRVHLLIAGSGEDEHIIRRSAQNQGVTAHFLGFRNQSEMPRVYAAADVLALPSDANETWGLVVNEALACGKPVVASDAAGCADDLGTFAPIVRTYPAGDVAALARALEAALSDPPGADAIASVTAAYGLNAASRGILSAAMFALTRNRGVSGGARA
jgi:glycosyltransferase involved in cell wall biosynthesis